MPGNEDTMPRNKDTIYFFPDWFRGPIPPKPKTRYQTAEEGWGDRRQFQGSFGLGMDPDSIGEGNAILDAMREGEYMVDKQRQKRGRAEQQRLQEAFQQRQQADAEKK